MNYKTNHIHTYSDMIREAILYLRPDLKIDREKFYKLSKKELKEIYCYIKNTSNEQRTGGAEGGEGAGAA